MSSRQLLIIVLSLTLSWASSVNPATAQPAASDKLVRFTYPVADLVIPIENFTAFKADKTAKEPAKSADEMARVLVKLLTDLVTKESWETHGGPGTIQYFPLGRALVVNQRRDVHDAIARVLGDLRSLQDVQVSIEMRFITVSPKFAERLLGALNDGGQPVRALDIRKPAPVGRFVSLDDTQLFMFLEAVQGDRSAHIMQAPKITLFNGQQAGVSHTGLRCDLLPVVDPDHKNVRVSMDFEFTFDKGKKGKHIAKAAGTFMLPTSRTLVWHQGEFAGQHLFVLMTPRVIIVKEETVDKKDAGAEEQSAPVLKLPDFVPPAPSTSRGSSGVIPYPSSDAKERTIENRLRQPISLQLKDRSLAGALRDISSLSGVQVVPDMAALQEARISLDTPVSIHVEDIDMKYVLSILLKPMRLTYMIEDQVLKITTEETTRGRNIRKTYPVADLIEAVQRNEGRERGKSNEAELIQLIKSAVAKSSWEDVGGMGNIQYFPLEKALIVNQHEEAHADLAHLLASLRRLNDLTVNIDVRLVHALPAAAQEWRKRFTGEEKFLALDEAQCLRFLKDASGDPAVRITQIPTLKIINGQRIAPEYSRKVQSFAELKFAATTAIETEKEVAKIQSSWRCDLHPVVSPDRRFVRTAVNFEHFVNDDVKSVAHRLTASKEFNITDGGTIVWDLGETAGQHLFLVLTPGIRVRQQEERLFMGEIAPIPGR